MLQVRIGLSRCHEIVVADSSHRSAFVGRAHTEDEWKKAERLAKPHHTPRPLASISIAVVGEVMTVIVVATALVAIERIEIDFIQNDPQEIIVDAAGSIESVLRDVDLCFSPLNNKQEGINEMSRRANVHYRSDGREIDDHVFVSFT